MGRQTDNILSALLHAADVVLCAHISVDCRADCVVWTMSRTGVMIKRLAQRGARGEFKRRLSCAPYVNVRASFGV